MEKFTNSKLRAFAVVEAQLTKGLQSSSEYLIPLFQYVISKYNNKHFDLKEVTKKVSKEYGLEVPYYFTESLIGSLVRIGSLEYDKDLNIYTCKKKDLVSGNANLTEEHFNVIETRLEEFSAKFGYEKSLKRKKWIDVLLEFFSSNEITETESMLIGSKELDYRVVAKFIIENKSLNNDIFGLIKRIYVAYSLAETIASIKNTGHIDDWKNLVIIYDAPVLLRLVGTSGEFLKEATMELHRILVANGCKTRYFNHSINEAISSLDSTLYRYGKGEPIHRETAQAIECGEINLANISLLRASIADKLNEYDVTEIDIPDRMANVTGQINPIDLEKFLKENIHYRGVDAARADADSIEKTLFLRSGKRVIELPKSQYLFVTHNGTLARCASGYCRDRCGYSYVHTPPVVTLSSLTKLAWLAAENGGRAIDLSTDLICKCYQASLPDEAWFNKFWKIVENTSPELLDSRTTQSLYLLDVRKFAEDATVGCGDLLDLIDIGMVIGKAKDAFRQREKDHSTHIEKLHEQNRAILESHTKEMGVVISSTEAQLQAEIKARQDMVDSIKRNANRRAKQISKIITALLALVCVYFSYVFTVQAHGSNDLFRTMARNIAIVLTSLQILGLFFPRASLVFLGPLLEKGLENLLLKSYMSVTK